MLQPHLALIGKLGLVFRLAVSRGGFTTSRVVWPPPVLFKRITFEIMRLALSSRNKQSADATYLFVPAGLLDEIYKAFYFDDRRRVR